MNHLNHLVQAKPAIISTVQATNIKLVSITLYRRSPSIMPDTKHLLQAQETKPTTQLDQLSPFAGAPYPTQTYHLLQAHPAQPMPPP